jgi:sugar phosphate isomerase/epimerase
MTLPMLLDDALITAGTGFALRVSLPWIRSMPLAAVSDVSVSIDGEPVAVHAVVQGRSVPAAELSRETAWWFIQDRLELRGDRALSPGSHDVSLSFTLAVPYLQTGPAGPLTLPFRAERPLDTGIAASVDETGGVTATASRTADAAHPGPHRRAALPDGWILSASAFNWTPEVIRAERTAEDVAVAVVSDGVSQTLEIEAGQVWRSFPEPSGAEVDHLRERLTAIGGAVTIVGASLDDWALPARRRSEAERLGFLEPQLRAAARLGARGVRVPFGQAGPELLRLAQPLLAELGVVLFEEIQGQQTLDSSAVAANLALLDELGDPRIRVLIDISMLMPSVPPSYLEELRRGGAEEELVVRLEREWRAPETHAAVLAALRGGRVPPAVHTLFMNLLVRFGRSEVSDLEPLLPLTGAIHLKFWDLDDENGRVSRPIADIGAALRRTRFTGTLTSEWGGHEWLDADPAAMTSAHLDLARRALAEASVPAA